MQTYDAEEYLTCGGTDDAETAAELLGLTAATSDDELDAMASDLVYVTRQDGIKLTHATRALRHLRAALRRLSPETEGV